jgi:hypothetical protein
MFQKVLDVLSRYPEAGVKTITDLIRKKTVRNYFVYSNFDDKVLTVLGLGDMMRNPKFIKNISKIKNPHVAVCNCDPISSEYSKSSTGFLEWIVILNFFPVLPICVKDRSEHEVKRIA